MVRRAKGKSRQGKGPVRPTGIPVPAMPAGDVLDEEGPQPPTHESYESPPVRPGNADVQAPPHGADVEPDASGPGDSEWIDEEEGRAGR